MDTFIDLFETLYNSFVFFRALLSNVWTWINKTLRVLTFLGHSVHVVFRRHAMFVITKKSQRCRPTCVVQCFSQACFREGSRKTPTSPWKFAAGRNFWKKNPHFAFTLFFRFIFLLIDIPWEEVNCSQAVQREAFCNALNALRFRQGSELRPDTAGGTSLSIHHALDAFGASI